MAVHEHIGLSHMGRSREGLGCNKFSQHGLVEYLLEMDVDQIYLKCLKYTRFHFQK